MNLNLGSSNPKGRYKEPTWINLDYCKVAGIQVRGSAVELPFRDNSFDLIHGIHFLEHLTREKTLPVLEECYRVLKPGATLFIEVPDFEEIVYLLSEAYKIEDQDAIHLWRTSVFGKNERPGMAHYCGFDLHQLKRYFARAKFINLVRYYAASDMISAHYKQEPVILISGVK